DPGCASAPSNTPPDGSLDSPGAWSWTGAGFADRDRIEVFGLLLDVKDLPASFRGEGATVFSRLFERNREVKPRASFFAGRAFGQLMLGTSSMALPDGRSGVLSITFRISRQGEMQIHVRIRDENAIEVIGSEQEVTLADREIAFVVIPAPRLFERTDDRN